MGADTVNDLIPLFRKEFFYPFTVGCSVFGGC